MPTTEHPKGTRPPVRELPDDDDQDVDRLTSKYRLPDDLEPHMRAIEREMSDLRGGGITVCDVLRTAIRAALDERDTALLERCERLRLYAELRHRICYSDNPHDDLLDLADEASDQLATLTTGDLADDLRPRGGDVLT